MKKKKKTELNQTELKWTIKKLKISNYTELISILNIK